MMASGVALPSPLRFTSRNSTILPSQAAKRYSAATLTRTREALAAWRVTLTMGPWTAFMMPLPSPPYPLRAYARRGHRRL